jgi:D-alanyl-D-alanine carboxypeptidase
MPIAEAPAAAAHLPPDPTVYAFKPSARVERQAAGTGTSATATRGSKPFGQSSASHDGWIVQLGAFDIEREAQQRLSSARAKVGHALDHAQSITEAVPKGEKTLYRARLVGFQQKEDAEAVCQRLKQNEFDCMTIKN